MARRYAAWFSGSFALLTALLLSMPVLADEEGWEAAKRPGTVILMRHALAPGTGDPADFDLADCGTQRNLSDEGREQARKIGVAFKQQGVEITRVLTSQWCRCRETAELLDLGPVEDFPPLNSFFRDRSTAESQIRETLDLLDDLPEDERLVLVTHQVNITGLTDVFPKSGEAIVIDVAADGDVDLLGRILIDP
ncbi:MAG: histidine phosphatase family protein [Pseudomonadota bacterium]